MKIWDTFQVTDPTIHCVSQKDWYLSAECHLTSTITAWRLKLPGNFSHFESLPDWKAVIHIHYNIEVLLRVDHIEDILYSSQFSFGERHQVLKKCNHWIFCINDARSVLTCFHSFLTIQHWLFPLFCWRQCEHKLKQ